MKKWPTEPADGPGGRQRAVIRVLLEVGAATGVALGAQLLAVPEVCREESLRAVLRALSGL